MISEIGMNDLWYNMANDCSINFFLGRIANLFICHELHKIYFYDEWNIARKKVTETDLEGILL